MVLLYWCINHSECNFLFAELPIRLKGGSNVGEGRLEVYYNNSWAKVCSDGWNDHGAAAVCRQLGLSSSGWKINSGQANGTKFLIEVRCVAGQSNIFQCPHSGFGNGVCSRDQAAGVQCSGLYGEYKEY